jgi:hypothetical protein
MSAARIAELKTQISQIDAALLEIATGNRKVKLSYEGNSVEYGPGNVELLQGMRRDARAELNRLTGVVSRPARMTY